MNLRHPVSQGPLLSGEACWPRAACWPATRLSDVQRRFIRFLGREGAPGLLVVAKSRTWAVYCFRCSTTVVVKRGQAGPKRMQNNTKRSRKGRGDDVKSTLGKGITAVPAHGTWHVAHSRGMSPAGKARPHTANARMEIRDHSARTVLYARPQARASPQQEPAGGTRKMLRLSKSAGGSLDMFSSLRPPSPLPIRPSTGYHRKRTTLRELLQASSFEGVHAPPDAPRNMTGSLVEPVC